MSEWADDAMDAWAEYLDAVRHALNDLDEAEVDAVIGDLEEHATREFATSDALVTRAQMTALIHRLGTAEEIANAARSSRRPEPVNHHAHATPLPATHNEFAFLGYASVGLLMVGALIPSTIVPAFLLAFVMSRTVFQHEAHNRSFNTSLHYPALAIGAASLAAVVALWPFALVIPLVAMGGPVAEWMQEHERGAQVGSTTYWMTAWSIAAVVTGLWALALRRIVRRHRGFMPFVLFPFVKDDQ